MYLYFELGGDNDIAEYDTGDLVTARETYEQ